MREFLAGMAIFLIGVKLMEDGLIGGSIGALKRMLHNFTNTKLKSVLTGTLVSAVTQSSTITSVMTVAFVGAGVMALKSAVGVMMGANIGATLLGVVMGGAMSSSFKLSALAYPLLSIGGVGQLLFKKRKKIIFVTNLLLSFGLIFYGIDLLKTAVAEYAMGFDMGLISQWGIRGFCVIGIFLTALMHSSDAMVIISLALLGQGLVGFPEAMAIVIGANLGTCISAIESSMGGSAEQKQVAYSHLFFNLFSLILGMIFIYPSMAVIKIFFDLETNGVMALAMYDVFFNIIGVVLIYPFLGYFTKFLQKLVSVKKEDYTMHIAAVSPDNTELLLPAFRQDIIMLLKKAYKFNVHQLHIDQKILLKKDVSLETKYAAVYIVDDDSLNQDYNTLTVIEEVLIANILRIAKVNKLTKEEHPVLIMYREIIERIIYSARTLWHIKTRVDALHEVRSPFLNQYLQKFKESIVNLYLPIASVIEDEKLIHTTPTLVREYWDSLDKDDMVFMDQLSDTVLQNNLSSGQLSDLMHIEQAITRSNKAMLRALDLFYMDGKILERPVSLCNVG